MVAGVEAMGFVRAPPLAREVAPARRVRAHRAGGRKGGRLGIWLRDNALRARVLGGGSVEGADHVVEGWDPWRHVTLGEGCLVVEDHVVERRRLVGSAETAATEGR